MSDRASAEGLREALRTAIRKTGWQCDADEHASAVHDKQQCYCEKFADALEPRLRAALRSSDSDSGIDVHINTGQAEARAMAWSEGHTEGYNEASDNGLDVERLARALIAVDDDCLCLNDVGIDDGSAHKVAKLVVAEYARLSAPRTETIDDA